MLYDIYLKIFPLNHYHSQDSKCHYSEGVSYSIFRTRLNNYKIHLHNFTRGFCCFKATTKRFFCIFFKIQLRVINQRCKVLTTCHKELFEDLFRLATSRYMEVRQKAQQALGQGFYLFAYSYKVIIDDIIALLKDDPGLEDHQFKVSKLKLIVVWTVHILYSSVVLCLVEGRSGIIR